MSLNEEYLLNNAFLSQSQGAWESVNGNPDVYIFRGYDGGYYPLAYAYDKESERVVFPAMELIRMRMVVIFIWE
jgi:hypothetical protein